MYRKIYSHANSIRVMMMMMMCCLPSIYINKDEPHLYTNISKVYLTFLRLYKTILLLHHTVVRNPQTDQKDCGSGVPAWRLM